MVVSLLLIRVMGGLVTVASHGACGIRYHEALHRNSTSFVVIHDVKSQASRGIPTQAFSIHQYSIPGATFLPYGHNAFCHSDQESDYHEVHQLQVVEG